MEWTRCIATAACIVATNSCSSVTRVEVAKRQLSCEVHEVPMTERAMPETPLKGIEDNGYHPEVRRYFDARERRFPHTGVNTPSCCGYHGGQLFWICPECVKEESIWIRRHPESTYPIFPAPDPRL